MALEYNINLDMDKSDRSPEMVAARVGDHDSVKITASLTNKGVAYTPQGTNAYFECVTSAGTSVRIPATKSTSSVSVLIPMAALVAPGVITCAYFRFESGTTASPMYVESTQSFGIIVPDAIDDNIVPEDYIAEWRQLQAQLEQYVDQVEAAATQAKSDIAEQKEEVDELKTQAQTAIAQDTVAVENAKTQAISDINATKEEVADAAEDVTAAGDQAISQFKTSSQQAINSFNTNGTSAINQFDTNANDKLDEVDGMITEAQGDVDAAITQLESETQNAIKVAQDALDGTTAANLQNAINRTLKLDVADMTNIPNNASLSSFTNVGSYCCKTASAAATIGDCPIDDSPFNMYVFSSATSGQVMQLVVPIDLQGKPTAEWHVRFGTSSAMDPWSVIGGGADISAGLGIDVTGDAKKTVALDTTAFYQHHEAASIIQGSTEATGGGRIKELTVYGNTWQNLWVNPSGTALGITLTSNKDGSLTVSGTSTQAGIVNRVKTYSLRPGSSYKLSVDKSIGGNFLYVIQYDAEDRSLGATFVGASEDSLSVDIIINENTEYCYCGFNTTIDAQPKAGTYRVMLNEGSEPEPWCPPGLNGVEKLSIVTAGKNLASTEFDDAVSSGITFNTEPDGSISAVGTATSIFPQRFKVMNLPSNTDMVVSKTVTGDVGSGGHCYAIIYGVRGSEQKSIVSTKKADEAAFNTGEFDFWKFVVVAEGNGVAFDCRIYTQLELGSTATPYEPPAYTTIPVDLDGYALNSLPDGTRDELRVDGTGAVTLTKRTQTVQLNGNGSWIRGETPFVHYQSPWSNFDGLPSGFTSENLYVDKLSASNSVQNGLCSANTNGNAAYLREPTFASDATGVKTWMGTNTPIVILPLATPQEVELPGIVLPDLASPDYVIYASSNVPAEIEADAVKVDYLPASDVYTKEEVDKKIEDAGGMPDIVPVSQGGTGVTTAAAERNRLGLGNTTGALPVANGGTGAANAKAAQYNLLADMTNNTDSVDDNATVVFAYGSGSTTSGAVYKQKLQTVWGWIVGKIRSAFGFDTSNVLDVEHGGTGFNDYPAMLVDLESTSTASPYQSASRPGVTGTLPVSRGGTGATSAANARTNIAAAYGISSVQGSLSDSTKVTSDLSSSANTNFTLSSLWNGWLEDKISTFLSSYGTFKKIYQNSDQSMTAQSNAVLQAFQNGKLLILVCRLYVPSYNTTTEYESGTKTWTGPTFPTQIPTAMVPTSALSDWNTLTPIYRCGTVSTGGSSNWNNRLVLQQVKLASNGRSLTGSVNTFDTVATNKTPNQVWVNAYMFLVE